MKSILLDLPMPINSKRLLLKPPEKGDSKVVNEAVLETFDKLHPIMPWAKERPSIEDTEEFVRSAVANWILKKDEEPYLPLFIFDKNNGKFLGNWEIPCLEIGYWIRESVAGNGIMTEAVAAITRYAIDIIGVKRVEIRCDVKNIKSKKIPERLGFHLEATLKWNRINPVTKEISDTHIFVRHNTANLLVTEE